MVAYIWWNHFQIIVSIYVQCLASCTQPPIKQAASCKHKQAFKAMKCEKSTSKHTYILLKLGKGIQKHNYSSTSTLQKMTKMAVKNEKPLGVRLLCYCRNKKEIGLPTLTSYGDTNTGFALTLEP